TALSMTYAPGADDDASGCAAILEIARIMMLPGFQPRCNIRFVTFAMEEPGKVGAFYCSYHLRENGTRLRVYINLDMVAFISLEPEDWQIRLHPYTGSEQQHQYAFEQAALYRDLIPVDGVQDTALGDSQYFWWNGFPTIYIQELHLNPHMHTVEDTIDKLNPQYCSQMVKAIMASLAGYSLMPAMPREMKVLDAGNGNALVVEWADSHDDSITQYKVCHSNIDGSILGEEIVEGFSHTISDLAQDEEYTVKLYSMDADGKHSFWVQGCGIPRVIPQTPLNLCETPIRDAILISWDANIEADLAGYILHKSNSASHLGSPVTTLPIPATSFTDTEVNSQDGFYYYTLQAIDLDGNTSELSDVVSSRPITFDRGILIVDETKHSNLESPYFISNDQVDAFYEDLLTGFAADQFDCEEHDELLRLADIGVYSSILWHGNDMIEMDYIARVKPVIEGYLAAGGKMLFSVMGIDRSVGQDDFAARCLGIQQTYTPSLGRLKYANSATEGFIDMEVDSETNSSIYDGHLSRITALYPTDSAQILYVAGSDYEDDHNFGVLNGLPVGLRNSYQAGEAITLSIPLYYMYQNQARDFVQHVFRELFMESSANEDLYQAPPA
ncbi:MAG: M20/M25/M40 family metallo-hydrolase, partial [Candidatus Cloacimonetes bacterium]|nr:M20/M25/M40 family metallo-hydrolase [Candidatus Cloacimonadota bacterium]